MTEDDEFQGLYKDYRDVLNLTEYEETLSELVFKLDDEIDKGRDGRMNMISLVIGIMGLLQLITVVMEIVDKLTKVTP